MNAPRSQRLRFTAAPGSPWVLALGISANFLALASAGASETAEAATTRAPAGLDTSAILQVSLALIGVLALIVALGWMVRRMGMGAGSGTARLRVIGGVSVGNRERVVLIQVGEEQLLLGVGTGQVRTLHVLPKPLETAGSPRTGTGGGAGEQQGFSARLQQLMSQGTNRGNPSS